MYAVTAERRVKMTDYSRLSDFEINFLVAEALNKFEYVSDHNAEGGSAVLCDSLRDCDTYDYCNDPSDAWPLLLTLLSRGCTVVIDKNSVNGDSSAKTIERKIAELYLGLKTNKVC